jgi:hypothetical protein
MPLIALMSLKYELSACLSNVPESVLPEPRGEQQLTHSTIVTIFAASTSMRETMLRRRRKLRAMKRGPEGRGGRNGLIGSSVIVGRHVSVSKEESWEQQRIALQDCQESVAANNTSRPATRKAIE